MRSQPDGGHVAYTPVRDDPDGLRDQLVVCMGGFAGGLAAGCVQGVRGGQDFRQAVALARRLTDDPHEQLQAVADALQRAIGLLAGHRAALAELAGTIHARGAIEGYGAVALAVNIALAQRRP